MSTSIRYALETRERAVRLVLDDPRALQETELVHPRRPWSSLEDLELATLEYVWWFNNHRLLEPIGDVPPAEREEQYRSRLTALSEPARLKSNSLR